MVSDKLAMCPMVVPALNHPLFTAANILKMTGFIRTGLCDLESKRHCYASAMKWQHACSFALVVRLSVCDSVRRVLRHISS